MGIRSRDHIWQLSLIGMAALIVLVVGVLLIGRGDQDRATTVGQLTANPQGVVPAPAGPSSENDRDTGGVQRSVGAITDSGDKTTTTRKTLVASTPPTAETVSSSTATSGTEPPTTKTTVEGTTTSLPEPSTTLPSTTGPSTTEPPSTKPTYTLPTYTLPTYTLPTQTVPIGTLPTITIRPPDPDHSITPADLKAARERFASVGWDSYGMTVRRSCFCLQEYLGPFDVVVRNGEIASVTYSNDGTPALGDHRSLTIPGLFNHIEQGFDSDRMDVDFDKRSGVPLRISIDHFVGAIDDEMTITVSNFSPHRS